MHPSKFKNLADTFDCMPFELDLFLNIYVAPKGAKRMLETTAVPMFNKLVGANDSDKRFHKDENFMAGITKNLICTGPKQVLKELLKSGFEKGGLPSELGGTWNNGTASSMRQAFETWMSTALSGSQNAAAASLKSPPPAASIPATLEANSSINKKRTLEFATQTSAAGTSTSDGPVHAPPIKKRHFSGPTGDLQELAEAASRELIEEGRRRKRRTDALCARKRRKREREEEQRLRDDRDRLSRDNAVLRAEEKRLLELLVDARAKVIAEEDSMKQQEQERAAKPAGLPCAATPFAAQAVTTPHRVATVAASAALQEEASLANNLAAQLLSFLTNQKNVSSHSSTIAAAIAPAQQAFPLAGQVSAPKAPVNLHHQEQQRVDSSIVSALRHRQQTPTFASAAASTTGVQHEFQVPAPRKRDATTSQQTNASKLSASTRSTHSSSVPPTQKAATSALPLAANPIDVSSVVASVGEVLGKVHQAQGGSNDSAKNFAAISAMVSLLQGILDSRQAKKKTSPSSSSVSSSSSSSSGGASSSGSSSARRVSAPVATRTAATNSQCSAVHHSNPRSSTCAVAPVTTSAQSKQAGGFLSQESGHPLLLSANTPPKQGSATPAAPTTKASPAPASTAATVQVPALSQLTDLQKLQLIIQLQAANRAPVAVAKAKANTSITDTQTSSTSNGQRAVQPANGIANFLPQALGFNGQRDANTAAAPNQVLPTSAATQQQSLTPQHLASLYSLFALNVANSTNNSTASPQNRSGAQQQQHVRTASCVSRSSSSSITSNVSSHNSSVKDGHHHHHRQHQQQRPSSSGGAIESGGITLPQILAVVQQISANRSGEQQQQPPQPRPPPTPQAPSGPPPSSSLPTESPLLGQLLAIQQQWNNGRPPHQR